MAALLEITRTAAEPSLIIKWSGQPASFRWRGRLYDVASICTRWDDPSGREWFRVESEEGSIFLLGRDRDGWVAAPWPASAGERKGSGHISAGAGRFQPSV